MDQELPVRLEDYMFSLFFFNYFYTILGLINPKRFSTAVNHRTAYSDWHYIVDYALLI